MNVQQLSTRMKKAGLPRLWYKQREDHAQYEKWKVKRDRYLHKLLDKNGVASYADLTVDEKMRMTEWDKKNPYHDLHQKALGDKTKFHNALYRLATDFSDSPEVGMGFGTSPRAWADVMRRHMPMFPIGQKKQGSPARLAEDWETTRKNIQRFIEAIPLLAEVAKARKYMDGIKKIPIDQCTVGMIVNDKKIGPVEVIKVYKRKIIVKSCIKPDEPDITIEFKFQHTDMTPITREKIAEFVALNKRYTDFLETAQ